ncbi:copper homeostasis CutC domain-containing protein [Penicillium capsulatum]|uniref:Copper homeostasis protein cutC homolog n=1 Tax=Penicillium capsulatum TaxID=69766 RepID=A0A9W9IY60_9EURO|nr:copper homeostasis CutC domain-containing protein [Penicillium capsulatum]
MAKELQTDPLLLEIACFNYDSAIHAAKGGADRIDYESGGLSPSTDVLARLKSELLIPIYAMVRPHSKSFVYSDSDFEIMKSTLLSLKEAGADGFVFGILENGPSPTFSVDVRRNKELVVLACGRPCTFHRAFDCIPESTWDEALGDIVECGFSSILTSGGPSGNCAVDCTQPLATLVQKKLPSLRSDPGSDGQIPNIIVGGGVRSANIAMLRRETDARFFHSSALSSIGESANKDEVRMMKMALDAAVP